MAIVRVFNDNKHVYREQWRDQKIEIAPGSFIEMEESEAWDFRGTFTPVILGGDEQPDPRYFKMIRIEPISKEATKVQVDENKCMQCNYKASSSKDLEEHIDANHLDQLADKKLADERRAKTK